MKIQMSDKITLWNVSNHLVNPLYVSYSTFLIDETYLLIVVFKSSKWTIGSFIVVKELNEDVVGKNLRQVV